MLQMMGGGRDTWLSFATGIPLEAQVSLPASLSALAHKTPSVAAMELPLAICVMRYEARYLWRV